MVNYEKTETRAYLLRLPSSIRAQIFREAGLVRTCPISLLHEGSRVYATSSERFYTRSQSPGYDDPIIRYHDTCLWWRENQLCHEENDPRYWLPESRDYSPVPISNIFQDPDRRRVYGCGHERLPISLLFVCKEFNREATDVLYGENSFSMASHDRRTMEFFWQMSTRALAALRFLHIFLMEYREPRLSILAPTQSRHQYDFLQCLKRWQRTCRLLSKYGNSSQLDFGVEFTIRDMPSLEALLSPLKALRGFKNLRLKLANTECLPEKLIVRVARLLKSTVEKLTERSSGSLSHRSITGFPFEKLPEEIQLMVLSYTGLVFKNAIDPFQKLILDARGIRLSNRGLPAPMSIACCFACNTTMPSCSCSCNSEYQYSNTCVCKRGANSLFSVSRRMFRLATETFYSHNQFFVRDISLKGIECASGNISHARYRFIRFLLIDNCGGDGPIKSNHKAWILLLFNLLQRGRQDLQVKIIFAQQVSTMTFGWERQITSLCEALESAGVPRTSVLVRLKPKDPDFSIDTVPTLKARARIVENLGVRTIPFSESKDHDSRAEYEGRLRPLHEDWSTGFGGGDVELFDLRMGRWRDAQIVTLYGPESTLLRN